MAPNVSFSSGQSEKLYSLLSNLYGVGGYSHTFGALDPVQVVQMAPHLSSIYISGWQCSSTASTTNEPGPDFADYPSKSKSFLPVARQTLRDISMKYFCFNY